MTRYSAFDLPNPGHTSAPASAGIIIGAGGITPTGTIDITENGTYDVTRYASADVNVSGGGQSDYTSAKVTIGADTLGAYGYLYGAIIDLSELNDLEPGTLPDVISYLDFEIPNPAQTYDVVLNKGKTVFVMGDAIAVDVTGSATVQQYSPSGYDMYVVTITGDCTISVTI